METYRTALNVCLLFLVLIVSVSCQNRLLTYKGKTVNADRRIALLEGGPHQASWQANEFSLQYEYARDQGILQISGDISLRSDSITEFFYIRLHFLDPEGKIVESKTILNSGYRVATTKWHFSRGLEMPPNVDSIAFSYSGRVRSFGSDSSSWYFWRTP